MTNLYDYGGESSGVGAYCLMCAGGSINEKNPANICAYFKRLSGWAGSVTQIVSGQVVLEESPGTHIPDNDPEGILRSLSTDATGNVGSVEVSVDITHTWIGDLKISLRSPAGTEVILHDKSGGRAHNIEKTYTATTTPALGDLAGQSIRGDWQLRVSDWAGQDVGKLNNWRVVIHPA